MPREYSLIKEPYNMKIHALELSGYKRFMLNNITYLRYTPMEIVQLILGSNGSGKSSLLEQLTPLPAIPQDFERGGYKKITFTHRGSHYELNNYFNTPAQHEFIKDGVDLNDSRTLSEQKELVKKIFNITPEIHELLTGETLFHKMGPSERRKWFTMMSPTNYNYAIGVYGQLKERLRDIQGAIKLNQSRYVQESSKLLTETQEIALKEEVLSLRKLLDKLYASKPSHGGFEDEVIEAIQNLETSLQETTTAYFDKQKHYTNYEGFSSIEDIDTAIVTARTTTNVKEHRLVVLNDLLQDTQSKLDILSKTALSETHDIYDRIQVLENTIRLFKARIQDPLAFQFKDPQLAHQALTTILPTLSEICVTISPNPEKYYCRNTLEKETKKISIYTHKIEVLENQEKTLLSQKKEQEYHKNHDKTQCPQCKYSWSTHYNENVLKTIHEGLERVQVELKQLNQDKTTSEELVATIKEYFVLYKVYSDMVKTWTVLEPLWSVFEKGHHMLKDPRSVLTIVENAMRDIGYAIEIQKYDVELKDLYSVKTIMESDDKNNLERLTEELKQYSQEYHETNDIVNHCKGRLKRYEDYKVVFRQLDSYAETLTKLQNERKSKYEERILLSKKKIINNLILTVQSELARKEKQLSEVHLQAGIVESLKAEIESMEERQEILKTMTRRLSPTDGLIAKGLLGFINAFVEQMNSFIRKVWSWPLEIVPVIPETDKDIDLDYKFTVKINGRPGVPDINKGSVGMKEIIDLAFRLVAMKYLDVLDFPLVLDEFAKTLDAAHRKTAFHVISGLIAYSSFPQIYIVSHFYDCYGALRNADVSVLCESNIDLPQNTVFNQQLILR